MNCVHPKHIPSLLRQIASADIHIPVIVKPNGGLFEHDGRSDTYTVQCSHAIWLYVSLDVLCLVCLCSVLQWHFWHPAKYAWQLWRCVDWASHFFLHLLSKHFVLIMPIFISKGKSLLIIIHHLCLQNVNVIKGRPKWQTLAGDNLVSMWRDI